ncbi:unnamed protein product [Allacma fusca]|uniref:Uncharacterized protein n=1 Tax=Allacma fusca TaxID=39272 RepID=A0A8J2LAY8_9HEXA|nr:unnamed protein product [Allacma fusca]
MERRDDFHLAPIVATSVDYDSQVNDAIASFKKERGRLMFNKGCSVSILRDIADCLNFTIVARRSTTYMIESPPGYLTGDGKLLLDGEADISIYLAYITETGARHLQPLLPITVDTFQVFFRQPTLNSLTNIFILPFPPEVWLTLAALWLSFGVIFLVVFRLVEDDSSPFPDPSPEVTLSDAFLLIQLMEKGLKDKYIAAMYRKNKPQCPPKPKKFQKLTLRDVHSAFVIILLGSILSLVTLYLECLSHPRQKGILPWRMMQEDRRASILIYVTEH